MFFSRPGEYEACGMFTTGHFILLIVTILSILLALKFTHKKNKEEVHKIIKTCTIVVWILEILIIIFKMNLGNIRDVNTYLPLYYCSLLLYAGLFSSFGKGKIKRTGDVFLVTGGIIGGVVFMLLPTTSLTTYPIFHFVSLYSFVFHGIMVYLGILLLKTTYIKLEKSDIKYYAALVGTICIIAYIVNCIFDSNLMFISKNFPGTPLELLYNMTGPFYTLVMIAAQMTLPFYFIYYIDYITKKQN